MREQKEHGAHSDASFEAEPNAQVRRLFQDFAFMPLPLTLTRSQVDCVGVNIWPSEDEEMGRAIDLDPMLLDIILANGEQWLRRFTLLPAAS